VVSLTSQPLYPRRKSHKTGDWVAPGTVWTLYGREIFVPLPGIKHQSSSPKHSHENIDIGRKNIESRKIFMSRHQNAGQNYSINMPLNKFFNAVAKLKYLGTTFNQITFTI
jgi:hypothetical protein